MRFRWVCIALFASQCWGCGKPRLVLTHVEPTAAYRDHDVLLTLTGDGFIPATTLDPATGSRVTVLDGFHVRMGKDAVWVELTNLTWQSTSQLAVTLPIELAARLPVDLLNVELTDPRGQEAMGMNAFEELGDDDKPPTVSITLSPTITLVGPETTLRGNIHASDAPFGIVTKLDWTYSESEQPRTPVNCSVPWDATDVDCHFEVSVNSALQGGESIKLVATAFDNSKAHIPGSATLAFTLQPRPTVQSIWPIRGGTAGGTDVVITGSGFLAGGQAILDRVLLFPDGGIVVDDHTLSGHVPAHAEGAAAVVVRTPLGHSVGTLVFTYEPPPLIQTITPSMGSAAGGTAVVLTGKNFTADTRIYFGPTLDTAVLLDQLSLKGDSKMVGSTPAGSGQTTVWAWDESLGFTRLTNGYTWSAP
jgi:hypothetical protein